MIRSSILSIVIFFCSFLAIGQETRQENLPANTFQFIDEDSIALFFNDRYNFIEKACMQNVRLVRLNKDGQFDGYFEDYTLQDRLLGKGRFANGVKDGYFEIYHPSGSVYVKGFYKNDAPWDVWEYYYDNGALERRLQFTSTDTLLMDFTDENGNVLVKYGNGLFKGPVNALGGAGENYVIAEGLVVNGRPHGKWIGLGNDWLFGRIGNDWSFCNEEFNLGKYLGGTAPGSNRKKREHFRHLNKFILKDYFQRLDDYSIEKCSDSTQYSYKPKRKAKKDLVHLPTFDAKKFRSFLGEAVQKSIVSDIQMNGTENYPAGDQYVTIRFSVDENGEAEKFDLVSSWGAQLLSNVKNCISTHTKFPPGQKALYFQMKFTFSGDAMYTYKYDFSNTATNQL